MNRRIPAVTLAAAACLTLAACSGTAAGSPQPRLAAATPSSTGTATPTPSATAPALPQSDGTLQILAFRGYAESGGKLNWVGSFEKETGCRVARLSTVQTAEEMAVQLSQRPYDVISAGPELAGGLVADGAVQPIDTAKVTGYTDLSKRFRQLTESGGKVYGVPFLWTYGQVLYDPAKVQDASPARLFESDRVALRDTPLTIADAALAYKDELGVDDPFELTPAQLDAVMKKLAAHKDGRTYWKEPITLAKGFATGSFDLAQATPYYRLLLGKAGKPYRVLSAPATTGRVDSWMLGANVPNIDCAYRWLSWMAKPDVQRDAASWVGMAPASPEACKGRAKEMCAAYGAGKADVLEKITFAVRPPGDCRPKDRECTDYATWTERWRGLVG